MDAKDYEAMLHLYVYELNKIDKKLEACLELAKKPGYDLSPLKQSNDAKIAELQSDRATLANKYVEFDNSIYDFLTE